MMQICAKLLQTQRIIIFICPFYACYSFLFFSSDTYLSFEYPSYFVSEKGTINFPINIIKQEKNATATENVYDLTVQIKSKSNTLTNEDFIAKEAERNISPYQKKVDLPYFFTIIDDGIIEANESFVLSISPVTNEVQWSAGDYIATTITIIDDDGKKMVMQDYENETVINFRINCVQSIIA